jgi:hypothetical protein
MKNLILTLISFSLLITGSAAYATCNAGQVATLIANVNLSIGGTLPAGSTVRLINGNSQYWLASFQVQEDLSPLLNADGSPSSFGVDPVGSCVQAGSFSTKTASLIPIFPGNILSCQ